MSLSYLDKCTPYQVKFLTGNVPHVNFKTSLLKFAFMHDSSREVEMGHFEGG